MIPLARRFALPLLGVLLLGILLLAGPAPVRAEDPPLPAPADLAKQLAAGLKQVYLADGLQADQVTLFPVYVLAEPAPLEVAAMVSGSAFAATEVEGKPDDLRVRVLNPGPRLALLLGGSILEGGKRDRIVARDVLIPSADARIVDVLPASMAGENRKAAADFKLLDFLAPPYVREAAITGATKSMVPKFVSHFLDFRNPSDTRKSLAAIGEADALAEYCLVCQRSLEAWPQRKGAGVVVGGLAVVRGRVQSLELFATNAQMVAWFEPVLQSLTFPAAAMQLRAKKIGLDLPKGDEATLTAATAAAKDLLAQLGTATFEPRKMADGAIGQSFKVKLKDGTVGDAIALGDRLVHLALFPDDPFDRALYSKPMEPLVGDDASDDEESREGLAELARRQASGQRLTEAEKRILDRLRENRGLR
jgi:hypothetical protein